MMLDGAADTAAVPVAEMFLQGGHQAVQWPSSHRLPWGGNKLAVKYCNSSSLNIYSERDSCAVASVQIHNPSTSAGSSLEKKNWQRKAGGMTQLQAIKWTRKRKLNGPGRFYKYVTWGLWQIWPQSTCGSPVRLCDSTMLGCEDPVAYPSPQQCHELGKCCACYLTCRQREKNYLTRVSESAATRNFSPSPKQIH